MDKATFCDDCPFAKGVEDAALASTTGFDQNSRHFTIDFEDEGEDGKPRRTNAIRVKTPHNGYDSTWPKGTINKINEKVDKCSEPVPAHEPRLGGVLGHKAVMRCGAFPLHNPNNIHMFAEDTGQISPADFD